jgi:uncharacterized membrane protein
VTDTAVLPIESASYRNLRMRVGSGLLAMGIAHVVAPAPFVKIIPDAVPNPKLWNLVAAAAEATAGVLLLQSDPKKQRLGGALATVTFLGVYPANIDMAIKAGKPTNPKAIAAWARLPMQLPMIRSGIRLAKGQA